MDVDARRLLLYWRTVDVGKVVTIVTARGLLVRRDPVYARVPILRHRLKTGGPACPPVRYWELGCVNWGNAAFTTTVP